jgi:SAM-dependent methyltransferase
MNPPDSTVDDFSTQWEAYVHTEGYYASKDILQDFIAPFVTLEDLGGSVVAEIGCGNGRFIRVLSEFAEQAVGVEPGKGFHNAKALSADRQNTLFVNADVYALPELPALDHCFCIGVLHHLGDPARALTIMKGLLKPGGQLTIWVYGHEGNALYLATFGVARKVTQRMPHRALHVLSTALTVPLKAYIAACRVAPLPMRTYMRQVLARLDFEALRINVYDQLNPKIAYYWKEAEVRALMEGAGLQDVKLFHRHGYSWTATGTRAE